MSKRSIISALAAVATIGVLGFATPASAHPRHGNGAGEWQLNVRACPDLREDIRDRRVDNGWRDRREDRRDERVTRCPASAWTYIGPRGRMYKAYRAGPPRYTRIVVRHGQYYGIAGNRSYPITVVGGGRYDGRYADYRGR